MKTIITTAHEEQYSDKSRTLGVLCNNEIRYQGNNPFKESLIYIYREGMYIFFNTIVDLIDYLLYGEMAKMKRAYMSEADFDILYDAEYIDGKFSDKLVWTESKETKISE